MTRFIDLNCDIGEYDNDKGAQREAAIMPHVSSANVACGLHAGDARVMRRTMQTAKTHGLAVGAHPSFADRENFGRREIPHSADQIYELTLYQIGASAALAEAVGVRLNHVKPHGALYNMAARDRVLADAIARAVRDFDAGLVMFGLSGSKLIAAAQELGLKCASEVFADRRYEPDGKLAPRSDVDALIHDVEEAARQVLDMVEHGFVWTRDGSQISVQAETVCIHGDSPTAPQFAQHLAKILAEAGVELRAVERGD
ncbi:MAG: LamB/YcsF family protein [Betaproteobacteria bacterium]|jgi:UPF0271 protein|nr:MAG: LamB/YcsF family protein [Betaproteobacteria bacterium]